MIGAVKLTNSSITKAIMNCLYGPRSPQNSQVPPNGDDTSNPNEELGQLAENPTILEVGSEFDDPLERVTLVEDPISDPILDDLLSEEGEGFLAGIEMVSINFMIAHETNL